MAELKPKTTIQSLLKKGFLEAPGDHNYFEFHYDGVFILSTKVSRGTKPIYDSLISAMANQTKVGTGFFKQFAICTKSKADYIAELKKNGIIEEKKDQLVRDFQNYKDNHK